MLRAWVDVQVAALAGAAWLVAWMLAAAGVVHLWEPAGVALAYVSVLGSIVAAVIAWRWRRVRARAG